MLTTLPLLQANVVPRGEIFPEPILFLVGKESPGWISSSSSIVDHFLGATDLFPQGLQGSMQGLTIEIYYYEGVRRGLQQLALRSW